MSDRMQRAMAKLDEVLGKTDEPEPAPAPDPGYPENFRITPTPNPTDSDFYFQPGGGFGSHAADRVEADRQRQFEQKLAAEREARESEIRPDPQAHRISELERRTIELERRLAELEPRDTG